MSPEHVAVRCSGVSKSYTALSGAVAALSNVDAVFNRGTLTAVVGPSGSGKSTLVRLIARLDEPDTGEITAGDVAVTTLYGKAARSYRSGVVSYCSQRAVENLIPHLRIREQVTRPEGLALIQDLGLAGRLDARAGELSGGEQARAALALTLERPTQLFLVDEPTAELDSAAAAAVARILRRLASYGKTVIVATHDPDIVEHADAILDLAPPRARAPRQRNRTRTTVGGSRQALHVRNLHKRWDAAFAIEAPALDLAGGELGVLLGRSGSGKSTLAMTIAGFCRADGGSVKILSPSSKRPFDWATVAYVPQRFGLLPELTVAENVALPLRLRKSAGSEVVEQLLEQLDLAGLSGRSPRETSIGQQQRIALARALVAEPALLIADEPASHQDAASAELVWQALSDARDAGSACLIATHDQAARLGADRIWEIRDGRVTSPTG